MKKRASILNKWSAVMLAVLLLVMLVPVQAMAAGADIPVVCGSFDSNNELLVWRPGIPVYEDDTIIMFSSPKMRTSGAVAYAGLLNDEAVLLEFAGTADGMDLYSVDTNSTAGCVPLGQAYLNETYTLKVMNTDKQVLSFDIVIVDTETTPTDDGLYRYSVDFDDAVNDQSIALPAAVMNSRGQMVALVSPDGDTYGFTPAENGGSGNSGSGSGSGNGGSNDGAAPTRPSNEGSSDGEAETTPDTSVPAETSDGSATNTTTNNDDTKNDDKNKYLLPIIGAGAVVVLAVVVVLVMKSKGKKQNTYQGGYQGGYQDNGFQNGGFQNGGFQNGGFQNGGFQDDGFQNGGFQNGATIPGGETIPGGMGTTVNGGGMGVTSGWEDEPKASGPKMTIVDSCGLLNGASFQIGAAGALIGRAAEATIRYPADTKGVSRNHCRLYWQGNTLMIIDSGSTSGTYLNAQGKIRTNVPVAIKAGDVIYLGSKKVSLTVKG